VVADTLINRPQYLLYKLPIHTIDDKRPRSVPTLSYRFPNSQGDAVKFLHGESYSDVWGKKYGRLYRVWNGMSSEMYDCKLCIYRGY
jgi:hypothetical protein